MFIKNIHVSLCSINLCSENGPGKKCIWKRICQIHQIRWIKYKYKYMVWNLIKYKYKCAVFVFVFANTNTYLTLALVNIGSEASVNGLFPDGTKPLPEPMLPYHHIFHWQSAEGNFTRDISAIIALQSLKWDWKLLILKSHLHLPRANELINAHNTSKKRHSLVELQDFDLYWLRASSGDDWKCPLQEFLLAATFAPPGEAQENLELRHAERHHHALEKTRQIGGIWQLPPA